MELLQRVIESGFLSNLSVICHLIDSNVKGDSNIIPEKQRLNWLKEVAENWNYIGKAHGFSPLNGLHSASAIIITLVTQNWKTLDVLLSCSSCIQSKWLDPNHVLHIFLFHNVGTIMCLFLTWDVKGKKCRSINKMRKICKSYRLHL